MTTPKNPDSPHEPGDWMTPPLSGEQAPLSDSSILVGVLALGESTEQLNRTVAESVRARKGTTIMVLVASTIVIAQSIWGGYLYNKVAELAVQNNEILATAQRFDAANAAAGIGRADYRMDRTIYCINNHIDHVTDPNGVALDERCPLKYPSLPSPDQQ